MPIAPLSPEDLFALLDRAAVPEHSAAFMQVMSGGTAFCRDDFLFLAADDWLMGIGYPLKNAGEALVDDTLADPEGDGAKRCAEAFDAALTEALAQSKASACWAVAPRLPDRLQSCVETRDEVYILDCDAPVPKALRGPVAKASALLRVTEDRAFSPAHRRLWAEFLGRADMRPNVRELYARTEAALAASLAEEARNPSRPALDLRLLNAWDAQGNLAASLLIDYSPKDFCAYIIGAHSKKHYAPHATDLLFASLLERGRAAGRRFIHLGLGVNPGIARFKRKWGGRVVLPYAMAAWTERGGAARSQAAGPAGDDRREISEAMRGLLSAPADKSKAQIFETFPQQRTFAMLFEVRKAGAVSYLGGSAHFFRYSFEFAFRDLFEALHTVIFEGPLDENFLSQVEAIGRAPEPGAPRVADAMREEDTARLERTVYGPEGFLPRLMGSQSPRKVNVRALMAETRPWFCFFTLWVAYLERLGWNQSVDLEAWNTAKDMGKAVIAMENLDEQIASLEAVPIPRVVEFFKQCECWRAYSKRNVKTYLAGDLQAMMGSSIEFPSRTERVINYRDERFRQRMRPFLEAGNCAVFVGTAHLVGLIPMLREDGFTVTQVYPGPGLKLRAWWRGLRGKENWP